jgi:hypothetical protein
LGDETHPHWLDDLNIDFDETEIVHILENAGDDDEEKVVATLAFVDALFTDRINTDDWTYEHPLEEGTQWTITDQAYQKYLLAVHRKKERLRNGPAEKDPNDEDKSISHYVKGTDKLGHNGITLDDIKEKGESFTFKFPEKVIYNALHAAWVK